MNTYTDGKLTFRKSKDGSFFSVRATEKNVRIADIPRSYMGLPVTCIEEDAFSGCGRLTVISIPESITDIGLDAFSDCRSVGEVHIASISAWCSVTLWNEGSSPFAFSASAALIINGETVTEAKIPDGITEIKSYAFCGCKSIERVILPESVTSVGSEAFFSCSSLTSINIPDGVSYIGEMAFCECEALGEISLPDKVTYIRDLTFCGCTSLTSVSIADTVTSIGNRAFFHCTALKEIFLPSGLLHIGNQAFAECTSLESIEIPNTVTSLGIEAFSGCTRVRRIRHT